MGTIAVKDRRTTPFGALLRVPVSLWLVVALMAMSFGAGVIVKTIAEPPAATTTTTTQLPTGLGTVAPPLSDEQISGGLPEGHPDYTQDGGAQDQTGNGGQNRSGGGQG
jgi:hypothetical protein